VLLLSARGSSAVPDTAIEDAILKNTLLQEQSKVNAARAIIFFQELSY
jgi:hypothetical protein